MVFYSYILPTTSLIVSLLSLAYAIRTNRRIKRERAELERRRLIGADAYIAEQIQRWSNGELPSRKEKGVGVSGTDIEIIEPISGWKIVVGTIVDGKRVPRTRRK